ncbi:MAG: sulfurtransferase [Anaerolineae bacterium]|nr:sulfurtransferase [Anaerolineae bacterium]
MTDYTHSEVLVSTDWVHQHLDDPNVRIAEVNEHDSFYQRGHIPGAIELEWTRDLNDSLTRDLVGRQAFEAFCVASGISNDTTVVFYGRSANWWACYAFWTFKLFGHQDVRLMDGGREKWVAAGLPMSRDMPQVPPGEYNAPARCDANWRAFHTDVLDHNTSGTTALIDVRTAQEYSGESVQMPMYPNEGAVRAGHIPSAVNIVWSSVFNRDSTFRSYDELRDLYMSHGVVPDQDVITYCQIGERSSITWFVLTFLLGYPNVRNYDGGWQEWGNMVRMPIEKLA